MRLSLTAIASIMFAATSGCGGGSVSKAQYDRLHIGMNATDIEDILGKGKVVDAAEVERLVNESSAEAEGEGGKLDIDLNSLRGLRWGSDKKNITVIFQNDRLFRRFHKGL